MSILAEGCVRSLNLLLSSLLLTFACLCGFPAFSSLYYVAPCGSDAGAGTLQSPWKSIARAQSEAAPGDTVIIRGGRYAVTSGVAPCKNETDSVSGVFLNISGVKDNYITYKAAPNELPIFDFSGLVDNCRVKGFNITASWVMLEGVEIKGVMQNNNKNGESWGVWISGDHNVVAKANVHHIMGAGLFIAEGGGNLVEDVDSHDNYDPLSTSGAGQNADGFGSHSRSAGELNIFRRCRAWNNSDDGFDLINSHTPVLIESSVAWMHGYKPGTDVKLPSGNGNGFKMGGYANKYIPDAPVHIIRNSVAFENKAAGFYVNHHPREVVFINNTSYKNKVNFNMLGIDSGGKPIGIGRLINNVSFDGQAVNMSDGTTQEGNSWQIGSEVTQADFISLNLNEWKLPRQANDSIPETKSLQLSSGSALIGKAVKAPEFISENPGFSDMNRALPPMVPNSYAK